MAKFFSDDFLRSLQDRVDIVEVISSYVPLKKTGSTYKACCPFHSEKTPSFNVNSQKQFFHCFGCHKGGDVFRFVQDIEKCDFVESVEILAEKAGVELPHEDDGAGASYKKDQSKRKAIFEANRLTARYFHTNLMSPEGKFAREYLTNRGLTEKLVKRFGLGYSLDSWDALKDYLISKGFEEKLLKQAGLINTKDDKRYYDSFRNRIMFPILDHRDNVLGFGGRVMDQSQPKYINSPETLVYSKTNSLYGIHTVKRLRNIDKLLVVEGYMDVIALHMAGVPNAVASLGTAMTEQQARLMRRFTPNIYIAYDGDAAGQKATLRGLDILNDQGLNVRVVSIPDGLDPDDYSQKHGSEGIIRLMDMALSLPDYKMGIIKAECDLSTLDGRNTYVRESCKQVLCRIQSPVIRNSYIKRLHEQTGIDSNAIAEEIGLSLKNQGMKRGYNTTSYKTDKLVDKAEAKTSTVVDEGLASAEKYLIYAMITSPPDAVVILSIISHSDFMSESRKRIVQSIGRMLTSKKEMDTRSVMLGLSSDDKATLAGILGEYDKDLDSNMLKDCLTRVMVARFDRQIEDLSNLLRNSTMSKDEKTILYGQLSELMKKREKLT